MDIDYCYILHWATGFYYIYIFFLYFIFSLCLGNHLLNCLWLPVDPPFTASLYDVRRVYNINDDCPPPPPPSE